MSSDSEQRPEAEGDAGTRSPTILGYRTVMLKVLMGLICV